MQRPPHNADVEFSVLGSILFEPQLMAKALDILPEDFYFPAHKEAWKAFQDLHDLGEGIDIITATGRANGNSQAMTVALNKAVAVTPTSANFFMYKKLLKEYSLKRNIFNIIYSFIGGIDGATPEDCYAFVGKLSKSITEKPKTVNIAAEVRSYIELSDSYISVTGCYNQLSELLSATGATSSYKDWRKTVRAEFIRLKKEGKIRPDKKEGHYRRVDDVCPDMVLKPSKDTHPVILPFRLRDYVKIFPKNIIVVGGVKSSGKTAFLLNTAFDNRDNPEGVFYYNSEMGEDELVERLENFETPMSEWGKIHFKSRVSNFADVVKSNPNAIHIIDFLELYDEFYRIGEFIREIFDVLGKGVAIIAIQKNPHNDLPLGGARAIEKARLVLAFDYGCIKIVDAKNFARKGVNPRGWTLEYKLIAGCKYHILPNTETGEDWSEEKKEKKK